MNNLKVDETEEQKKEVESILKLKSRVIAD